MYLDSIKPTQKIFQTARKHAFFIYFFQFREVVGLRVKQEELVKVEEM